MGKIPNRGGSSKIKNFPRKFLTGVWDKGKNYELFLLVKWWKISKISQGGSDKIKNFLSSKISQVREGGSENFYHVINYDGFPNLNWGNMLRNNEFNKHAIAIQTVHCTSHSKSIDYEIKNRFKMNKFSHCISMGF